MSCHPGYCESALVQQCLWLDCLLLADHQLLHWCAECESIEAQFLDEAAELRAKIESEERARVAAEVRTAQAERKVTQLTQELSEAEARLTQQVRLA